MIILNTLVYILNPKIFSISNTILSPDQGNIINTVFLYLK